MSIQNRSIQYTHQTHVAIIVQPACTTALLVEHGKATILRQGDRGTDSYAYGYAAGAGLPEPVSVSLGQGDARPRYERLIAGMVGPVTTASLAEARWAE